jgi:hypothetical protein
MLVHANGSTCTGCARASPEPAQPHQVQATAAWHAGQEEHAAYDQGSEQEEPDAVGDVSVEDLSVEERTHSDITIDGEASVADGEEPVLGYDAEDHSCSDNTESTQTWSSEECGLTTARRGTGGWYHANRFEKVVPGSEETVMQAAFTIAELRRSGVKRDVCDEVAKNKWLSLTSLSGVTRHDVLMPTSLHLVRAVLGCEDPARYEFGWCPDCGFRHPQSSPHYRDPSETCPECGAAK